MAATDGKRSPHRLVCVAVVVAAWAIAMLPTATAQASAECPGGATMDIVAHPDDDLLFQSPDLRHDITAGKCVRTVYITAGDRGDDEEHIKTRQEGVEAAYAQMAGVANDWTADDAGIPGHQATLVTLTERPTVSLVFMGLQEGIWGNADDSPQLETLQNLWLGNVSQVTTDDGSSTYTKDQLIAALTTLMNAMQPDTIRTLNYIGNYNDGDHDDHHTAAYLAHAAHLNYSTPHTFIGYLDYQTSEKPANVSGTDLTAKSDAFYTYLNWDDAPCGSPPECGGTEYGQWLQRMYIVGKEPDDGSGGGTGGGSGGSATGPTTTITSPTANQTVCGSVAVTGTAKDQSGSGMFLTAFRLDSATADPTATVYSSPWSFNLDTTKLADGHHTLYMRGADNAGNVGQDATVAFTVDNTSGACVPTAPGTGGGTGGGGAPASGIGPITTITSPTANETVCGSSVDVAATEQDQSGTGIWLTSFKLDSATAEPIVTDYSSPYGFSLDTTKLSDGQHTLYVRSADHTGTSGFDASVNFTVDNTSGACVPPPPPPDLSPVTTITSPTASQTVCGSVAVAATEEDRSGSGIWLTSFRLDGANADPVHVDYDNPYGFNLDTTKLSDGQHTLYVRSADHDGNVGHYATVDFTVDNSSGACAAPPPPPDLSPVTSVTSPAVGQTVSGTIDVAATVQDRSGSGVWLMALRLDNQTADPIAFDYGSPWGFSLDTTQLSDGQHTLYVRSADQAGNVGKDAIVTFTVDNANAPPGGGGAPPPNPGPIVTVTNPVDGQTVSGTIDLAATVQDQSGSGIWLTVFRLDSPNADPAAVDYGGPWGFSLDTTQLSNGLHTLYVRSEDNALNTGSDTAVTFYVNN